MKSSETNIHESEILVAAIERVLRQLTKILVGRIAFPKYLAMVRKMFVEEAENHLRRHGKDKGFSLTDLGLLTGLDTRTLNKIRESANYGKPLSQSKSFFIDLTPEAVIIDKWQSDPEFLNSKGSPAELKLWGKEKSFESLVQSTIKSRGITIKSILKRLLQTKSVSFAKDQEVVKLHPEIWVSYQATDEEGALGAGLLAVSQHLNTVMNNIQSVTDSVEPRFERIFWCNRVEPNKLQAFRASLESFLESTSDEAVRVIEKYDKDLNVENPVSGGVGFYYFDSEIY